MCQSAMQRILKLEQILKKFSDLSFEDSESSRDAGGEAKLKARWSSSCMKMGVEQCFEQIFFLLNVNLILIATNIFLNVI